MEITQDQNFVLEPSAVRVMKIVDPDKLAELSKALKSPTRQKILSILREQPMDVSRLAHKLNQTEANISAQIQNLQAVGLVVSKYEPGGHGVRKICEVVVDKIIITLD